MHWRKSLLLYPIESNCNFNYDTFSNDPAGWKSSEELVSYFVEKEYVPQNKKFDNAEFINSTVQVIGNKQRFLSKSMFKRKMINGEEVDRTWLIFSPKTKMLYCGVCKLFSPTSTEMLITKFNDWKNAASRLLSHENSHLHFRFFQSWCTRSKKQGLNFCKLYESQCDYWKKVLQRIIDVIYFCANEV